MNADFINIHCHQIEPETSFSVQNQYVNLNLELEPIHTSSSYRSIGVHPWYTNEQVFPDQWAVVKEALKNSEYLAIGECGLDRLRGPQLSFQEEILKQQCALAEELKKPVILHLVKTYSDILAFQKRNRFTCPMIIHGFTGNATEAQKLTDAGFYLSFGKALLSNSTKVQQSLRVCPIQNLFLETDTSDLPISTIYQKTAKLKGLSLPELAEGIHRNFQQIV